MVALAVQRIARHRIKKVKHIKILFYFESLRVADLTNKAESVMDLLVDYQVIEDDNWCIVPEITLRGELRRGRPGCEIFIYT